MILAELIEEYISGDWGNEELSTDTPNQVYCVRAADFVPILSVDYTNIPIRYISNAAFNNKRLKEGDIVIEKSGGSPTQSTGRVIIVTKELLQNKPNLVCSNFCEAFRVKEGWNPFYVFTYLQFLYNQGVFFNFEGKTSGLKNLQMEQAFNSIDIPEQKSDISILASIDEKIALNHKINIELESLAKEMYDYWFIQFDFPNEEGKPYKSSGGKMVWNGELKREIPEGWNDGTLKDFLLIKNGRDHKNLSEGSYSVYGSGGKIRKVDNYLYDGESILIPRKGSLNNIMYVNERFWTVDTMFYSEVQIKNSALYVYYSIKDIDFTKLNTGTGVPSMTTSRLYMIKTLIPSSLILSNYDKVARNLYLQIKKEEEVIAELKSLRDYLLHLLMNGQITTKD